MSGIRWTKPYHGVQCTEKFNGYWCSVCDRGSFAELKRWYPGCQFSPYEDIYDNIKDAREAGEKWLLKSI
jgi:hypothetical protein